MNRTPMIAVALAVCPLLLAGCGERSDQAPPSAGAVEVGVITLSAQSVSRSTTLPGRVVAFATAEIRPEVDGIVRKRVFQEGAQVAAGDVLYELDATPFRAAYNAAAASLQKTEASVASAQSTLARTELLAKANAVSTQDLEDARTALLQAQADVELAKADLETAKINLDHATLRAPIAGLIGTSSVSVGSLVTANQTDALATIRQINPIYVDLVDSSANLLRLRTQIQAGALDRATADQAKVRLTLENGSDYQQEGRLSLAEVTVSESTGSFLLRATFPNPERALLPGMFVRAAVDLGATPNAFLVPQRAVTRNASGTATAYFVSADGKAQARELTTVETIGNDWLVTGGVATGDRLIVDGFQKITDGAAVTAVEASLDENGVVRQRIGAADKDAAQ